MTSTHARRLAAVLSMTVSILGCGDGSSTTGPSNPPGGSRNVRFEATGNYSGKLVASFSLGNGATTVEDVPALPWTKDITYQSSVLATAVVVGGTGGVAGQTIVVRVLVGGTQVSSTPGTALSSGAINVASPPYLF